ncbi:hypothetical protein [Streptomyces sp. NPDC002922]|uniref:hypothetical protein n=1 Tax=Streptomyces sp. NPDC002922 TaxID=3154439 RepID=UPI0033A6B700
MGITSRLSGTTGPRGRVEGMGEFRPGAWDEKTACPLLVAAVGEGEPVAVLREMLGPGGDEVVLDEVPRILSVLLQPQLRAPVRRR